MFNCSIFCILLMVIFFFVGVMMSYMVVFILYILLIVYNVVGGIGVFVGMDDVWLLGVMLFFNFCFYGVNYNFCVIGFNGFIKFGIVLVNFI